MWRQFMKQIMLFMIQFLRRARTAYPPLYQRFVRCWCIDFYYICGQNLKLVDRWGHQKKALLQGRAVRRLDFETLREPSSAIVYGPFPVRHLRLFLCKLDECASGGNAVALVSCA